VAAGQPQTARGTETTPKAASNVQLETRKKKRAGKIEVTGVHRDNHGQRNNPPTKQKTAAERRKNFVLQTGPNVNFQTRTRSANSPKKLTDDPAKAKK